MFQVLNPNPSTLGARGSLLSALLAAESREPPAPRVWPFKLLWRRAMLEMSAIVYFTMPITLINAQLIHQ